MANNLLFEVKRGDTAPLFRAQCLDGTTPISLATAATVKLLVRNSTGVIVNAVMTVEDQTANTGWVRRSWQATDLAVAGTYQGEVEVTWSDGSKQTFPPQRYITILVYEDIA